MSTTMLKLLSWLLIGALVVPFVVLLTWSVWVVLRTLHRDNRYEDA